MKTALFFLGVITGLGFTRIPHYVGILLADEPVTPYNHKDKHYYFSGGVRHDND